MTSRANIVVAAVLLAGCAGRSGPHRAVESEAALVARARAIHERVITVDTHVDINPANFAPDEGGKRR